MIKTKKPITLEKIFAAVKDIKHDIKFLREDSADMEDHINDKIKSLSEKVQSLELQSNYQHNELKNMLYPRIFSLEDDVNKLKKIHPKYSHQPVVA